MVSIIIPIYNAERWLPDCLESINLQSFKDYEVLMVDDGSTDSSSDICDLWTRKDARFKHIAQSNQGVSAARNRALEEAHGEYVCFVDSDDIVAPDYLDHLLRLSKNNDFPICGYTQDMGLLGQGRNEVTRYEARDYIKRVLFESVNNPNIWMMLFKNSVIRDNRLRFVVGCVRNEDTEFFIHYMLYEQSVAVSNYKAYYYRPNPDSVMRRPVNIKSLTSIEASRRMNELMVENGLISDREILLSNGVLKYAVAISRWKDKGLYEYLHLLYDVKLAMKKMIAFPRLSKRIVAALYLVLGKKVFYCLMGVLLAK